MSIVDGQPVSAAVTNAAFVSKTAAGQQNVVSGLTVNDNLKVGTTGNPSTSAVFEVVSTTEGAIICKMNNTQRNAIGTPATGLMIYSTTDNEYQSYDGGTWVTLGGGGGSGDIVGPASSTDDVLAVFDGTTGKLLKNSSIDKDDVVTLTGSQVLTNKTLTTPTIGSFTNATHAHTGASSGGTIAHTDLTSIGTNTHAQIDTHIANTSNPHSVTIAQVSPLTTKGDVLTYSTVNARLGVGTNGHVLTADSGETTGLKWAAAGSGINDNDTMPLSTATADTLKPNAVNENFGVYTDISGVSNSTATGSVYLETGSKTAGTGNSGSIIFRTGTSAGGTRGTIQTNGNLVHTGDILPATSFTYDIGSTAAVIKKGYFAEMKISQNAAASYITFNNSAGSERGYVLTDGALPSAKGVTAERFGMSATTGADLTYYTSSRSSASTNSGNTYMETGNATGTTSNSGNIELQTGTATQTRGRIKLLSAGLDVETTITTGGTTGNQTINKVSGTVNFAAAATSLVVTNNLVTTSSLVFCTIRTNDATLLSVQAVPASGSFTIYANAAATAETSVGFLVIN
jgi:hypothetical protein